MGNDFTTALAAAPPPPEVCPSPVCPAPPANTCDEQSQLTPEISSYYGNLILARMRSVRGVTGQTMTINWAMVDSNGMPIDLTACGFPVESELNFSSSSSASASSGSSASAAADTDPQFVFRIRETLSLGFAKGDAPVEFDVFLRDAESGTIRIVLPSSATGLPGVYYAEVAVKDTSGLILFTNVFYVIIERGQFGASGRPGGPPRIAEIRLHLRDSSAEESLLLDNIRFSDVEVALAIGRPVEYWNEMPPDLGVRMTTQNFPFRFHWMEGITAGLFWMLEEQFRANHLSYSAAGVQVNDQDKEPNYARAAERRWANFVEFVKRKKGAINLENGFGGIGSGYRYAGRYGGA